MRTGRPPKPEGQKVNRHKPTHAPVELPAVGPDRPAPSPSSELNADEERLWAAMWKQPEAAMWRDADVPALTRLVTLQADRRAWHDNRLLAEMRQLEDRFGMNPTARRLLGWKLTADEEGQKHPEGPERSPEDRRSRLKVV